MGVSLPLSLSLSLCFPCFCVCVCVLIIFEFCIRERMLWMLSPYPGSMPTNVLFLQKKEIRELRFHPPSALEKKKKMAAFFPYQFHFFFFFFFFFAYQAETIELSGVLLSFSRPGGYPTSSLPPNKSNLGAPIWD